jgi:hypothetical protein
MRRTYAATLTPAEYATADLILEHYGCEYTAAITLDTDGIVSVATVYAIVLAAIASGKDNDTICKALSVSDRHARRLIAILAIRLGAEDRWSKQRIASEAIARGLVRRRG